jgi:hypothetical protein
VIQAGDETLLSEIYKLIHSIWNKEELPDQWKESLLYKLRKRHAADYSNSHGISLLSTSYKQNKLALHFEVWWLGRVFTSLHFTSK